MKYSAPFPLSSLCLIPRGREKEKGSYDVVCQSNQFR